jgi:SAM-dependent methyltransferase
MNEFDINTEDSSDHWSPLLVSGKNVLDLGCGRWCSREGSWDNLNPNEFSPIWLANSGAKRVVGVDTSINEINYFNDLTKDRTDTEFTFIHQTINSSEQILDLITKYDINVIKCDIEGAETLFYSFTAADFNNIVSFALEYHNKDIKDNFLTKLPEWGFKVQTHGKLWIGDMGVLFAEK